MAQKHGPVSCWTCSSTLSVAVVLLIEKKTYLKLLVVTSRLLLYTEMSLKLWSQKWETLKDGLLLDGAIRYIRLFGVPCHSYHAR